MSTCLWQPMDMVIWIVVGLEGWAGGQFPSGYVEICGALPERKVVMTIA